MSVQRTEIRSGTVVEFDEPVGLGTIEDRDGGRHPFHCTAIADGTRVIAVGADVSFRLRASRAGRTEAVDIVPR